MKRKLYVFVAFVFMMMALTSCLNAKITKASVPKHDKLTGWQISADNYAKKLEHIVTDYYTGVELELVSSTDTKLGKLVKYDFNGVPDPGYDFTVHIMEGKDGYINEVSTIATKDIEVDVEDEIDIYIGYTRICMEAFIMALGDEDISEDVEQSAQKLFDDTYLLDYNIKYETIFNSFSRNGYIKQIDR